MGGTRVVTTGGLPHTAAEYVRDSAQTYLDLQLGAVIAVGLTIVVALVPIAFGVWSAIHRSPFFVIVALVATTLVVWGGLSFANTLAERGDVTIGTKSVEGIVTAVQSQTELASVGLDTQSRALLVRADPDLLRVGDPLTLECRTIDGAIALSTPCVVVSGE